VNHHPLYVRPCIEEPRDFARVFFHEQNVAWLATLDHVVEVQPKQRRKPRRDSSRRSVGVGDRNADLLAARLIALGFFARENDELWNQRVPPGVKRLRLALG
jgi:hypothetical protein